MIRLDNQGQTRRRVAFFDHSVGSNPGTWHELDYPDDQQDKMLSEVLDRMEKTQLIVRGQDETGQSYIEPAHDSLINRAASLVL